MAEGGQDLTDREREVLRLLLAGHTAKSAAAELDLSVHTINNYLREARKKLGVSSSREAARVLGERENAPLVRSSAIRRTASTCCRVRCIPGGKF